MKILWKRLSRELTIRASPGGRGSLLLMTESLRNNGSSYCLFNAPDPFSNREHNLPLGFFITRVVADYAARTGKQISSLDVLADAVKKLLHHDEFAKAVFASIVEGCNLSGKSVIKMNGIDDYMKGIVVSDVERIFAGIFEEWEKFRPMNVTKEEAVIDDCGHLGMAAVIRYFHRKGEPDIVIFGHTHQAVIHGTLLLDEGKGRVREFDKSLIPSRHIYANTGTWINGKPCTFVETLLDEGRHHVNLKRYDGKGRIKLLGGRFIRDSHAQN